MITASVSHDMRTPINSITGLLQSLDSFIEDERAKVILKIMRNSSKILLFLVNDLLDFFMVKNMKFQVNYSPADVKQDIPELL